MTPDLVIANEAFLPPAPIVKTGIYAREGLNVRRIMPLVLILEGLLRPPPIFAPRCRIVQDTADDEFFSRR